MKHTHVQQQMNVSKWNTHIYNSKWMYLNETHTYTEAYNKQWTSEHEAHDK